MSSITAPAKYDPYPGNADLVYDAVCKVLSERPDQVDWTAFTRDDWQMLVMMAKSEGVGPLLYWYLGKLGNWALDTDQFVPDSVPSPDTPVPGLRKVPKEVALALKATYYQTAANNAVLFQELERILAAFEEAEIPVIVLKGAALAQTIYPDPGLRPMNDIDLLIAPENLGISIKILDKLGFHLWNMTYHALLVGGTNQNVTIELHWSLISPSAELKSTSSSRLIFHNKAILENYSAQFVYSSAHLIFQHRTSKRLLWGYDLYLLLEQGQVNGKTAYDLSKLLNWQGALISALIWVTQLFHLKWPAVIAEPNTEELDQIEKNLTQYVKFSARNNWSKQAYQILPFREKRIWVLSILFPSVEYIYQNYKPNPRWLWPLYYPYRWLDITNELIRTS